MLQEINSSLSSILILQKSFIINAQHLINYIQVWDKVGVSKNLS